MKPTRLPLHPLLPALAAVLALGPGCAPTLRIHVASTPETNKGQVLYMMVRDLDADAPPITEDYETAASRVFTAAASPGKEQEVWTLIPGRPVTLRMPRPERKQLVLYFFFSEPGRNWMTPIAAPLPKEIHVTLGHNDIEDVSVQRP